MPNFAISDGSKIVNVIVAESKEVAEKVSGMSAIEIENDEPWLEWTIEEEGWRTPKPYPSWSWSGSEWIPPVDKPEGAGMYEWNEELQEWENQIPIVEELNDN